MPTPEEILDFEKQKQDLIDEHGFMVMCVADTVPFAYTIGHNAKNLPEFALRFPITPELLHSLVHAAVREFHENNDVLDGRDVAKVLAQHPVRLRKLSYDVIDQNLLGARKHAVENGVEPVCYQVMLPDKNGVFPGEPGCDPKFEAMQYWPDEVPNEAARMRLH